jgi:hypothetical protein
VTFDPGEGPLGRLASSLQRPPATLAAFKSLTPEQLELLANAVDETYERRHADVNRELERAFGYGAPALSKLLRRQGGSRRLRRMLLERQG